MEYITTTLSNLLSNKLNKLTPVIPAILSARSYKFLN